MRLPARPGVAACRLSSYVGRQNGTAGRDRYLHDGRTKDLLAAIEAHASSL
jgi:hypothetical protein